MGFDPLQQRDCFGRQDAPVSACELQQLPGGRARRQAGALLLRQCRDQLVPRRSPLPLRHLLLKVLKPVEERANVTGRRLPALCPAATQALDPLGLREGAQIGHGLCEPAEH